MKPIKKSAFKNIPRHIAVIPDGNGRWATQKGLNRAEGHHEGITKIMEAVRTCWEFGIEHLTFYVFSTENWQRPKNEIDFLMSLPSKLIDKEIDELDREGAKINVLGRLDRIPSFVRKKIAEAVERLKNNTNFTLNLMFSYGSRIEIVDMVKAIIREGISADEINETTISNHLYTRGIPDPDLLIRTASEMRISNFLLWQIAYTEFYFTSTLWPDFGREHLIEAIKEYSKRIRKYGKAVEQLEYDL